MPESERYEIFASTVKEITAIENELNPSLPLYIAQWKKSYIIEPPLWHTLLYLVPFPMSIVLAVLLPTRTETFKYLSLHRLPTHAGESFRQRRYLALLGMLVTGTIAGLAGAIWAICFIAALVDGMLPGLNAWIISAIGLLALGAGYSFHIFERFAIPRPLRIYAGGTFELVSLKRVKTPKA